MLAFVPRALSRVTHFRFARYSTPRRHLMAVTLNEIKNLAQAYDAGELSASTDAPLFEPDVALNQRISLYRGDITKIEVDAIVNAANRSLLGGGGVDGAIHRAAGHELYNECRKLDGCSTGSAKITKGYRLPAKHVIHAVGPIYDDDDAEECADLLRGCYDKSLELTVENKLTSVAFSGISTGVYGYPLDDATHIALRTTRAFLTSEHGASVSRVIFTVFRHIDVDSYEKILPLYFPPSGTKPAAEEATVPEAEAAEAPHPEAEATTEKAVPDSDVISPTV